MRFALGGNVIGTLRAALLLLAGLGVVGTAAELAMERHWQGPWQLLPWLALGMIALALGVLLVRRARATVRFARICAALVILTAAVGVWRHVQENYDTAPLDARYTDRWETMSNVQRWWDVGRGSVGPAPLLALGYSCISAWPWPQRPVDWEGRPIQSLKAASGGRTRSGNEWRNIKIEPISFGFNSWNN